MKSMKHWTTEICDRNLAEGYKYTVFDRRSRGENQNRACNTMREIKDWIKERYPEDAKEMVRFALKPDSLEDHRSYTLMYYCQDGTFWVKGRVVFNMEKHESYQNWGDSDAGVVE
jgi:hypothetical protein